jgi:hypothetical protein
MRLCHLKEISGDRQALFLLLDVENTRNEFRRNASHVQILCESGLARTFKICQPPQKFHALLIAYLHEFAQASQNNRFCLLDVRLGRGSSLPEFWSSLNFLNHSNLRTRFEHSFPKAVFNISEVSVLFSPSSTLNLMHTRCSSSSRVLMAARNASRHRYTCSFHQSW